MNSLSYIIMIKFILIIIKFNFLYDLITHQNINLEFFYACFSILV